MSKIKVWIFVLVIISLAIGVGLGIGVERHYLNTSSPVIPRPNQTMHQMMTEKFNLDAEQQKKLDVYIKEMKEEINKLKGPMRKIEIDFYKKLTELLTEEQKSQFKKMEINARKKFSLQPITNISEDK